MSVLFIGGVAPDVQRKDLEDAFAEHGIPVLASSVVRLADTQQCVGQAYVTVDEEKVKVAVAKVTQIGSNAVMVLPVLLEAWVAPPEGAPEQPATATATTTSDGVAAAAAGGGAGLTASNWNAGVTAAPAAPAAAPATGFGASGVPAAAVAAATPPAASGAPQVPIPAAPPGCTALQAALDTLRAHLAANARSLACNSRNFSMLLNEVAQKRQLILQVSEAPEGSAFSCTISLTPGVGGAAVCSGRGLGTSKKDAKHSAAAACLDALLRQGELPQRELIAAMTTPQVQSPAPLAVAGTAGFTGGGAAIPATPHVQAIQQWGLYPRCAEVMSLVQATDLGRSKTVLAVLNEYAVRAKLTVHHAEAPSPGASALAGPFRYMTTLTDPVGNIVAQATGLELRSKQEAKQAAAAAAVEAVLAGGLASVDAVARGR